MQHGTFPETDPGPLGLIVGLPEHENHKRLRKILGTNAAFVGLAAQRNQNFSYYAAAEMKKFAAEIDSRGLIMIAGSDEADMPAFEKTVRPDVYIADDLYRAAIKETDVIPVSSFNSRKAAVYGSSPASIPPCGICQPFLRVSTRCAVNTSPA